MEFFMPRTSRLLIPDQATVYHVMSRTALEGLPLGDAEKDYLTTLIKQLSRLYFTEIVGFCCMGNHFHLLVRMLPEDNFSDAELQQRHELFFGEEKRFSEGHIPFYRLKYASLSELIKELKQSFSRWYNRRTGRRGFFWSERFKSVIVENGETLINCLAYIDLNPVRAGMAKDVQHSEHTSARRRIREHEPNLPLRALSMGGPTHEHALETPSILLKDYLALTQWTAERIRGSEHPMSARLNKVLVESGIDANAVYRQYQQHQGYWQRATGSARRLREYADKLGLKWIRRQRRPPSVAFA
jgi:hypothetical protein